MNVSFDVSHFLDLNQQPPHPSASSLPSLFSSSLSSSLQQSTSFYQHQINEILNNQQDDVKIEPLPIEENAKTEEIKRITEDLIDKSSGNDILMDESIINSNVDVDLQLNNEPIMDDNENGNVDNEMELDNKSNTTTTTTTKKLIDNVKVNNPFKGKTFYKCNICGRRYWNHEDHMRIHTMVDPFKCEKCSKTFTNNANLKVHMKRRCYKSDGEIIKDGDATPKPATNRRKLSKLPKLHSRPYVCTTCNAFFNTKSHLNRHRLAVHSDDRPYKCEDCPKTFRLLHELTRHDKIHTIENECRKCKICGHNYHNYNTHMLKHRELRLFKCDVCLSDFKTKHHVSMHMRIHMNKREYKCNRCTLEFNFRNQLKRHMRSHSHECPYQCDMCGSAFKYANSLKVHMRQHTGEKPFKCTLCTKAFTTGMSLRLHIRVHTGEKPFKCNLCDRAFADGSTLKIHKRLHTGENPYICHLCGKSTKQASNLKSHYRHFHKITDITGKSIRSNAKALAMYSKDIVNEHIQREGGVIELIKYALLEQNRIAAEELLKYEEMQPIEMGKKPNVQPTEMHYNERFKNDLDNQRSTIKVEPNENLTLPTTATMTTRKRKLRKILPNNELSTKKISLTNIEEVFLNENLVNINSNPTVSYRDDHNVDGNKTNFIKCSKLEQSAKEKLKYDHSITKENENNNNNSNIKIENETESDGFSWFNDSSNILFENTDNLEPIIKIETLNDIIVNTNEIEKTELKNEQENNNDNSNINLISMNKLSRSVSSSSSSPSISSAIEPSYSRSSSVSSSSSRFSLSEKSSSSSKSKKKSGKNRINTKTKGKLNEKNIGSSSNNNKSPPPDFSLPVVEMKKRKATTKGAKFSTCLLCKRKYINYDNHMKKLHPDIELQTNAVASLGDGTENEPKAEETDIEQNVDVTTENDTSKLYPKNKGAKFKTCTICNRKYLNHHDHMLKHTAERPFKCNFCSKSFKEKDYLRLHQRLHTDERNVICEHCGAAFHFTTDLRRHLRKHSDERPFLCKLCGKGFKESSALKMHMRSHTGERPYKCTVCEKAFSTSMGQKLHIRTHTGEKPYACDYCGSRFGDLSTFRQHVRIHTGERPYKCHLCGKGTTQAGNLKSHLRHYHKIIVHHVKMSKFETNHFEEYVQEGDTSTIQSTTTNEHNN